MTDEAPPPGDADRLAVELGRAITPAVPPLDPRRVEAVAARAATMAADGATALGPEGRSRRSLVRTGLVAAGGIAAGAAGVFLLDGGDASPVGPPTETAAVVPAEGVVASAQLIDHTWGLEVVLDVDGLAPGTRYEMTFVATDGARVGAGGFVGTGEPMRCRNNGALLRADTARFEVTDADGVEVLAADLT